VPTTGENDAANLRISHQLMEAIEASRILTSKDPVPLA
jgi:hypothetical protein